MRIRIITIHSIPNFGSVFQSYALCRHLLDNGYTDTEVIDYRPNYFKPHTPRAVMGLLLNLKSYAVRARKFNAFNATNLPMTQGRFTDIEQLRQFDFHADVLIAGGDQLWNVYHDCGNDDAYKLTFTKGYKISYATSMGQSGFSDEQIEQLAEKLRDFSAVSVRESSSVPLLAQVGIAAQKCVDPVFLLTEHDYERFIVPVARPKYLLVYLVTPSPLLDRCIRWLAAERGLEVVLCSGFSKKCVCDTFLKELGPDEILSYIYHAEVVLSSSFHATAFSLIFRKQFFTILPNEHTNERIMDLLRSHGLERRIVDCKTDLDVTLRETVDYCAAARGSDEIVTSKEYLRRALENV